MGRSADIPQCTPARRSIATTERPERLDRLRPIPDIPSVSRFARKRPTECGRQFRLEWAAHDTLMNIPAGVSSTFPAADGDGYELQMGRWSRRLAGPFLDFVGSADGESVLDVGCGTGCLTFALQERCQPKQLRGVDFSPVYIEHATRRNDDPKTEFKVGDACALAFPDRSFDRVLSLLMLHFVPRADQAIAEMRRVARPGAVVGAAVWTAAEALSPLECSSTQPPHWTPRPVNVVHAASRAQ